ncbi:hypothetical protein SAMN05421538_106182 [Paracoccus isoporae]|uniref:Uncharacterized protein n=1 Tax=Paracoccus isoporae TaxID=591205 RepID=A0A1G7CQZ4_9RHOB|nr:hypothetical protein [Paracoccus isoporae]SDE41748.1 hypothetical protein SAMN05421538_106182 [Paracoccus isoporae]
MQIAYHVGVHGSDQERILRTLLKNREMLWMRGVEVPAPNRYRGVFGDAINALRGGVATQDMQEMLLDAVMDSDRAGRVVLSQSGFLGMPQRAISAEGLYAKGHNRLLGLSNLFPDAVVEFFIGLVHPARQASEILRMTGGDYDAVLGGVNPRNLRWAPMLHRILQTVPDRDIVIWAQEDLPFIWPEVLRRIAGVGPEAALKGEDALLAELLPEAEADALQQKIAATDGLSVEARRQMVEDALTSMPDSGAMEAEVALPGWSQDLVDELSEIYATDLAEIAALPGIEYISA